MQKKVLFSVRQHDFSLSEGCGVFLFGFFGVDFVGFVSLLGGFFVCFGFGFFRFESSFLKLPPALVI